MGVTAVRDVDRPEFKNNLIIILLFIQSRVYALSIGRMGSCFPGEDRVGDYLSAVYIPHPLQ